MKGSCLLGAVAAGMMFGAEKVESTVKSEPTRGCSDVSEEEVTSDILIIIASSSEYVSGATSDSSAAPEEIWWRL